MLEFIISFVHYRTKHREEDYLTLILQFTLYPKLQKGEIWWKFDAENF